MENVIYIYIYPGHIFVTIETWTEYYYIKFEKFSSLLRCCSYFVWICIIKVSNYLKQHRFTFLKVMEAFNKLKLTGGL